MSVQALVSVNTIASASAVVKQGKHEGTTEEKNIYYTVVKNVVFRGPHRQRKLPRHFKGRRLYTVTTIASSAACGGTRTVAVCGSFQRARTIVENNEGDIFEHSYALVVIEGIIQDRLYPQFTLPEVYWYRWDNTKDQYRPIRIPPYYDGMCGFGIG
jgi:hypothetical protein